MPALIDALALEWSRKSRYELFTLNAPQQRHKATACDGILLTPTLSIFKE